MQWDNVADKEALLSFKTAIDSDDIKIKEQIKKVLLNNRFIIHVLNNEELEKAEAEPDDYYGINIKPYYLIPETQNDVQNFICYEVSYEEIGRYNSTAKMLQVIFHILCRHENIIDEDTGVARHDLLAALIQDQFNYTTYLSGGKLMLVSDKPSTTDSYYATRTLIFQQITDNNLVKTRNGVPKLINKEVQKSYLSQDTNS